MSTHAADLAVGEKERVSIAISFVIAPLLIRNMGAAQYGILLLVWSVTGILGVLQFGFGEATFRYVAYYYGGLPWALASVAFVIEHAVRDCFAEITWFELLTLGGSFSAMIGLLIVGADLTLGGVDAPSKRILERVKSNQGK
jgi:hypothetical protein